MNNTLGKQQIPFTQISNEILNNKELSLKAKGLYSFMYSKPHGWNFTIRSMSKQLKEGVESISSALKELKDFGIIEYHKNMDGSGKYHLLTKPNTENPNQAEIPYTENPTYGKPISGKPVPISNTDSSNTDLSSKEEEGEIKNPPELFEEKPIVDIKKKKLSELTESEIPSNDLIYYKTALSFYKLFEKNLTALKISTVNLEKAKYNWVDEIRLMFTDDKHSQQDFRDVFEYLQRDDCWWKSKIQGVKKLRIQMVKLLSECRSKSAKTTGVVLVPMNETQKAYHKMREELQKQA